MTRTAVLGAGWLVVMSMTFGVSLIGPMVIVVVPVMLLAGIGIVAAAHEYAHGDRFCEACGRVYEIDGVRVEPEPIIAPELASALAPARAA